MGLARIPENIGQIPFGDLLTVGEHKHTIFPILNQAQELDLGLERQFSDFVEEERTFVGRFHRFRPVMMTAIVAARGLVPFLFVTGPGSEIQRPLAIAVIGG